MPHRLVLSLLTCCMGLATAACDRSAEPASAPATSSLAVTLVPVLAREMQRSIVVSGPVTAFEEMQLGVEISGARVTALNVDVGQAVRRGEVLLELDHRTLDSELAQARAALQEAEAGVTLAAANFRRADALAKEQLVSAAQVDELRAARAQSQARRDTVRAQRDAAQLRRDFAELRAPADGIISRRLVQPGQVVAAGSELLRLIRDGRLEWRAELAENELAQVRPGAIVALPVAGGTIQGRVRAVSPGVDSTTRTGTIHADLPEPGPLQPGSFVEGRILTGLGRVPTVPAAAIVQRDGHAYVFTVDAGKAARRRRVDTGTRSEGFVEVAGLAVGDRVVAQGAGFLGDGDIVRVVAATPAAATTLAVPAPAATTPAAPASAP